MNIVYLSVFRKPDRLCPEGKRFETLGIKFQDGTYKGLTFNNEFDGVSEIDLSSTHQFEIEEIEMTRDLLERGLKLMSRHYVRRWTEKGVVYE